MGAQGPRVEICRRWMLQTAASGNLERLRFAAPDDREVKRATRRELGGLAEQEGHAIDLVAIDLRDAIALAQAGLGGGAPGQHAFHQNLAVVLGDLEAEEA